MEKFNYEVNGYNRQEVNQFVQDVIKETEGIVTCCEEQRKEIDSMKRELEHYRELEEALKQSIVSAERTSDNIKRLAREESDMILTDAKHNASRIVNEALLRAEKIEQKSDNLERNIKIFKRKLKVVMEQQMAVVEEIELLDFDDISSSNAI